MRRRSALSAAALVFVSMNSAALTVDMKPGLWEQTYKLDDSGIGAVQKSQQQEIQQAMSAMKKRFEEMPPEQREQVEQMMKAQGIDMGPAGLAAAEEGLNMLKNGSVVKTCVTQAEIDKGMLPSLDKNCMSEVKQISRKVYKIVYECKGENPSRGVGEVTFQNPKSFTGTMSYSAAGAVSMQGTVVGKWLTSDCGDVQSDFPSGYEDDQR